MSFAPASRPVRHTSAVSRADDTSRGHHPTGAFTLVELLIVIGVIGLLIAILLPVLARARESANQVKCLSNTRELARALIQYTNENRGWFPAASMGSYRRADDWIHWQTVNPPRELQDSPIARHMSKPLSRKQLECPSDNIDARTGNWFFGADGPYQYSYSLNTFLVGNPAIRREQIKINRVRRASEVILVVDESERTINDGVWVGEAHDPGYDLVAIRHDRLVRERRPSLAPGVGESNELQNPKLRGNVAFVDGHSEFFPRVMAHSEKHYDPRR